MSLRDSTLRAVLRRFPRSVALYGTVALISVGAQIAVLRLWEADLTVPFRYWGDALGHGLLAKSVQDDGWVIYNDFLAKPFEYNLSDFPTTDTLHIFVLKLLGYVLPSWAAALNMYYLAGVPLAAVTFLFVLRQCRVALGPAIVAAVLYAFLPYHFFRNLSHLFLSLHYPIPLLVLAALWVSGETPPLVRDVSARQLPRLSLRNRRSIAAIAIALLMSSTGPYYALFSCVTLAVAGVAAGIFTKRRAPAVAGMLLALCTAGGFFLNYAPNLVHRPAERNLEVARRSPMEAEVFALKITQLVLPLSGHRVPALARLKERYNATQLRTESDYSSLGLIGAFGFVLLLWRLLFRKREAGCLDMQTRLSVMNAALLVVGTIGGLGSLFATLVTPMLRSYTRVSVFIGCFSLFAVALLLDRAWRRDVTSVPRKALAWIGVVVLIAGGIFDQTTEGFVPRYVANKSEFFSDQAFVRALEATLPEGAWVFQLPYSDFPEQGGPHRLMNLDLLRGYLHSKRLRWSYGTIQGSRAARWQQGVAALPAPRLLATIATAGFSGLYIDRNGYPDRAARLEMEIAAVLHSQPFESSNGRLAFFNLESYRQAKP